MLEKTSRLFPNSCIRVSYYRHDPSVSDLTSTRLRPKDVRFVLLLFPRLERPVTGALARLYSSPERVKTSEV